MEWNDKMKIASCVRTLNEERHIGKFCDAYQDIADLILVADGGSSDKTVEIATSKPKTLVKDYPMRVECKNGIWRNPDGPHIQFLIDWAANEGADWIIFQDCDMRPNRWLKEFGRGALRALHGSKNHYLMLTQIFMFQDNKYFPKMSRGDEGRGDWMQGLWAWRASVGLQMIDHTPHFEFSYDGVTPIDFDKEEGVIKYQPPLCYLHFGWENLEILEEHWNYYRRSGLIESMTHPLDIGGKAEPILDWMVE
jgi:glycosyltransferase involved in cell wall biosynthesis